MATEKTTTQTLYQHEDGRNLVAGPDCTKIAGDPAWHRIGPVDVQTPQPTASAHVGTILNEIASLSNALEALGVKMICADREEFDYNDAVLIKAVSTQIGWLADLGAGRLGAPVCFGDAERWMLGTSYQSAEANHV